MCLWCGDLLELPKFFPRSLSTCFLWSLHPYQRATWSHSRSAWLHGRHRTTVVTDASGCETTADEHATKKAHVPLSAITLSAVVPIQLYQAVYHRATEGEKVQRWDPKTKMFPVCQRGEQAAAAGWCAAASLLPSNSLHLRFVCLF